MKDKGVKAGGLFLSCTFGNYLCVHTVPHPRLPALVSGRWLQRGQLSLVSLALGGVVTAVKGLERNLASTFLKSLLLGKSWQEVRSNPFSFPYWVRVSVHPFTWRTIINYFSVWFGEIFHFFSSSHKDEFPHVMMIMYTCACLSHFMMLLC